MVPLQALVRHGEAPGERRVADRFRRTVRVTEGFPDGNQLAALTLHDLFPHRTHTSPANPTDQIVAHTLGFSGSAVNLSTAAGIRNLSESELVVTCRLMKDGAVLEEVEIHLEANGQESQYIEVMFTLTDTSDFVGSVRCTVPPGEGMFTGVAVELDASTQIFTTLPVVPVQR